MARYSQVHRIAVELLLGITAFIQEVYSSVRAIVINGNC